MTMNKILVAAAALVLSAGVSMAETAAPAASTVKPAATAAASATAKPAKMAKMHKAQVNVAARSEASKACSAQADSQKLHGQPRREFRKTCMKSASVSAPAAKPVAAAPAAKNVQHASASNAKPNAGSASTAH